MTRIKWRNVLSERRVRRYLQGIAHPYVKLHEMALYFGLTPSQMHMWLHARGYKTQYSQVENDVMVFIERSK